MANAIDLTTIEKVKIELGITDTSVDVLLVTLVTAASRWMMTECGRKFRSSTTTKRFHGDSTFGLTLPFGPVTSVQNVVIDGSQIPPALNPGDAGWTLDYGRVNLVGYVFTTGTSNIEVTFTSGFVTVPEDLDQACVEMTCWMFRNRDRWGLQSRTLHLGESLTFRPDEAPYFTQCAIMNYRNVMGVSLAEDLQ